MFARRRAPLGPASRQRLAALPQLSRSGRYTPEPVGDPAARAADHRKGLDGRACSRVGVPPIRRWPARYDGRVLWLAARSPRARGVRVECCAAYHYCRMRGLAGTRLRAGAARGFYGATRDALCSAGSWRDSTVGLAGAGCGPDRVRPRQHIASPGPSGLRPSQPSGGFSTGLRMGLRDWSSTLWGGGAWTRRARRTLGGAGLCSRSVSPAAGAGGPSGAMGRDPYPADGAADRCSLMSGACAGRELE
jgi:hypothetical protein